MEEAFFGTTVPVFIFMTLILFGFCAFMTGQALANGWHPGWKTVPYAFLLAAADRFLVYGLFDGPLLSLPGYLLTGVVLSAIAYSSHRYVKARKMVSQYTWLYEAAGPFNWREIKR